MLIIISRPHSISNTPNVFYFLYTKIFKDILTEAQFQKNHSVSTYFHDSIPNEMKIIFISCRKKSINHGSALLFLSSRARASDIHFNFPLSIKISPVLTSRAVYHYFHPSALALYTRHFEFISKLHKEVMHKVKIHVQSEPSRRHVCIQSQFIIQLKYV